MKIDLAAHAEEYASLGWALVQLDGKMPIGQGWQRNQPVDPESARSIWTGKDCNMGLVLGPSGVIDFELDGGSPDLYWSLVGDDWPETPCFITGSGKPHILFKDPGGMTRRTRDGLELRAGAHQSVIPPSIHPDTGEPYRWRNGPQVSLADPPPALLEFFAEERKGEAGDAHWRSPLEAGPLGEGEGRYASLLSYLGMAVNQASSEEQLAAMAIAYSSVAHNPPYPDETIAKHAHDLWWKWHEGTVGERPALESLKIVRADKIVTRQVEFLWEPFLQRSAFHLLVGRKGAGKGSTLAWLAAQMTTGFLQDDNTLLPQRAVLWISTEDSFEVDVKPRFVVQGGDEKMLLCVQQQVLLPRDMGAVETAVAEYGVGMVVIDPIISVLEGGDANSEASVISAIGGLNVLADEHDLTVIGVRHLGKNLDRGLLESILGSAAWVNTPRAVLGIAQDEDEKVITMQILAGNRVRSRQSFDFNLGEQDGVTKVAPIGPTGKSMQQVLAKQPGSKLPEVKKWLEEKLAGGDEITKESITAECIEKFGVGRASIDKAATELKEEGYLRFVPGELDPITGRKKAGAPWKMVIAVPEGA